MVLIPSTSISPREIQLNNFNGHKKSPQFWISSQRLSIYSSIVRRREEKKEEKKKKRSSACFLRRRRRFKTRRAERSGGAPTVFRDARNLIIINNNARRVSNPTRMCLPKKWLLRSRSMTRHRQVESGKDTWSISSSTRKRNSRMLPNFQTTSFRKPTTIGKFLSMTGKRNAR